MKIKEEIHLSRYPFKEPEVMPPRIVSASQGTYDNRQRSQGHQRKHLAPVDRKLPDDAT